MIARSQTPGTRQPMKRTDSPIDVVYNAGRLGLRGAISNPLRIDLVSGAWLRIETSSRREDPCLWVGGPPHVNLMNNRFSRTPPWQENDDYKAKWRSRAGHVPP